MSHNLPCTKVRHLYKCRTLVQGKMSGIINLSLMLQSKTSIMNIYLVCISISEKVIGLLSPIKVH